MGLLVQVPWTSVSVLPRRASPVIVGGVVLDGGSGLITSVAAEVASADPPALVAVSCTFSLWPASPSTGTYVWPSAPGMFVQLLPTLSHCCHL